MTSSPLVSDARRSRFIRARHAANLGPFLRTLCVALFAVLLFACGPGTAARGDVDGAAHETDATSGGERVDGYTVVEEGVLSREDELAGVPFLEVVLGTSDPSQPLPLLFVLHGLGDYPDIPIGPYRGLSHPVRIVMPRGPLTAGQGFAWMSVRVADDALETLTEELGTQSERLVSLLAELSTARATRGGPVVIGFSQGGMLTLALGVRHPDVVALALPLAGWLPPALRIDAVPTSPRVVWMHGTADERVAFALAEEAAADLRAHGFDVTLVPYEGQGHSMSDAMDTTFHAWLERVLENVASGRAPGDGLPLP